MSERLNDLRRELKYLNIQKQETQETIDEVTAEIEALERGGDE